MMDARVVVMAVALALVAQAAAAQSLLFDSHVYLWKDEESLPMQFRSNDELGSSQFESVGWKREASLPW